MLALLVALPVLVLTARAAGALAVQARLPRVLGELTGGFLLGPTLLGAIQPELAAWVNGAEAARSAVGARLLAGIEQLGLALLMFGAGLQASGQGPRGERWRLLLLAAIATLTPLLLTAAVLLGIPPVREALAPWIGPAGKPRAFAWMVGACVAVTSLPVLSRILADLRLAESPFARRALAVSVPTNLALILVVAAARELAAGGDGFAPPLLQAFERAPPSGPRGLFVQGLFLLGGFLGLRSATRRLAGGWLAGQRSAAAAAGAQAVLLAGGVAVGLALGLPLFLAAFGVGLGAGGGALGTVRRAGGTRLANWGALFAVPFYFARIGAELDLRLSGDAWFFGGAFLLGAGLLKGGAVWLGARGVGYAAGTARVLAIGLNARGGPGIVFAEIAFGAGLVSSDAHAVLLLLAVLSSMLVAVALAREASHLREETD